jgi:transposase
VLPAANAETMTLHLQEISSQVAPGAHAVVVMDGAGWHQTGGELRVPANITPLPLPPYAPELNPVENVWAFLRSNKLSNRVFESYDAILNACADAWNWLTSQPDRIATIASRSWAQISQ